MLVYKDLLTEDELLDDSFARREIENGMLWEVEGKWVVREAVHVDIHANPSAKGAGQHKAVDDKPVKVIDIVDTFQLQEKPALDKDQFMEHMQRYREKLMPKLEGEKQEQFKKNIEAATNYLMNNLSHSKIYVGESMHEDCSLVFMCYKEGASDPIFLYLAAGLKEIKS